MICSNPTAPHRHPRKLIATALFLAFHGGAVLAGPAVTIDIPAQPLSSALRALASQAGIQLVFTPETVGAAKGKALRGTMSAEEALQELLAGSGLEFRPDGGNGYVVVRQALRETTFSEISVVATKTRNEVGSIPASVSVAMGDAFEEIQAPTIASIVRSMPNVEMGGGPRVDGLIPTIRGAYGASVTLLLDGARQNDLQAPGMKSPLYVDPYFIKELEVLRGASSSLYGTGGNGGVMSVSTLSARDLLTVGKTVGGGVRAGYNSSDSSSHLNARIFAGNDKADILLAIGKHDWDKIKQPGGTFIDPNDGRSTTGLFKIGVNPLDKTRVEFSHQIYQSDNLAINNPQANVYRVNAANTSIPLIQPTSIDQRNTVLKVTYGESKNPEDWYVETSLYGSFLGIQVDPYATNPKYNNVAAAAANYLRTETKTEGVNLLASKQFGNHRLVMGADTYSDNLISKSGAAGTVNSVNPAGERSGLGAFLQDEFAFGNGWKITPTLRYDSFEASESNSTQPANKHSRLSPKLSLAWENERGLMVYGSYGEGFRAPSVAELYNDLRGIFPLSNFYRNPTLKPEIDRTAELGSKLTRRGLLSDGDVFNMRAAIFNSSVRDLINSVNLGQIPGVAGTACVTTGTKCVFQYQNISNAERVGGELEASYSQGLWQYKLGYGRVRVKNTDSGENLFATPDKLTTQVRRAFPNQSLSVLWNGTFVASQRYDSTVLRRRSGYAVHDLFLSWAPTGQVFRVDAGVTNVFNKAYMIYQSANAYAQTYQPARSFLVSVNADF